MRKLKLQVHMTIDGFVSRPNGENDWVFFAGPDEEGFQKLIDLADTCDTLLIGPKMAPVFIGHWQNMANSETQTSQKTFGQLIANMRKIVFSRTDRVSAVANVEIESGDLITAVTALKNAPGKDLIIYGGGDFVKALISLNLIDEYYIIVNPIAIGNGLTIFGEQKILKLESSVVFKNGKILNKYRPG